VGEDSEMLDGIGKDTVELARQGLLGCLDRAKEIVKDLLAEHELYGGIRLREKPDEKRELDNR
jgi:hypothetical protein